MSGSIDPFGLMTKSGIIKDLGAIGLYDFKTVSKQNTQLNDEELKGLLYVKERAHINARYHQAVFYEFVPRFWAVNYGKDGIGNVDKSEWFICNNLYSLGMLIQEDEAGLRNASAHAQAIARRAVIFAIDDDLYEHDHQGATDAAAVAQWQMDMANATPLD